MSEMRQKFGVALLAAVMALAGTREAFRQFDELKTSVSDWTRTSILGNLLVSAAGSTEEDGSAQPQPPHTILLAQTRLACEGERLRSATQASRPASKTKAANNGHAELNEKFDSVHGMGELSLRFAATPRELHRIEVKTREQSFVAVAPQLAELAKTWGADAEPKAVEQAVRAREGVEAGAGRARVAAEWKKPGLRKVFVRVAREGGAFEEKQVFAFEPRAFATAFDLRSLAGLDSEVAETTVTTNATAQDKVSCDSLSKDNSSSDDSSSAPAQGFDSNSIFNNPAATYSLNCDSDPLG
jgi:hypothetical protein